MVGLVAAALRNMWDVERTSALLQPVTIFFKENKWYLLFHCTLSGMMCFFWLLYASGDSVISWSKTIEEVTCYIHLFETLILLIFYCAQSQDDIVTFATNRLFSDCLVIVSVLFLRGKAGSSYFSFSFCAALRIRNLWNNFEGTVNPLAKGFKIRMFHEVVRLCSRIFVFTALVQQLESFTGTPWMSQAWEPWETATSPTEVWTTSSSVYLVLCTLSTVGYGDVQPKTILGQVYLMVMIIGGLGLAIKTLVNIAEIIQQSGAGGGEYSIHSVRRMRRHIVVAGSPSAQMLEDLLEELYHDDHEDVAQHLDCVIMLLPGSQVIITKLRRFLHRKENRTLLGKVYMLQGSPLHTRDLERMKLAQASCGYVLPNVHAADSEREDIENAMRALSMHRHAPYVRLVSMLLKVDFREMVMSTGLAHKDIICIDELKLGIMGKTVESQGFVAFVCNLFKSAGEYENEGSEEAESWKGDYLRGMGNEIYEIRLNACYRGAPFGEVACDILKRSEEKAYMMGVIDESRYPGEEPIIRMHPGRNYRMGTHDDYVLKGIFIAPDASVIVQHPPNIPFSWHLDKTAKVNKLGSQPPPDLPNAVREIRDTKGSTDILVGMSQRWLLNEKVVAREYHADSRAQMENAAQKRTINGLKHQAHLPRDEVNEVMEVKVDDTTWKGKSFFDIEPGGVDNDPRAAVLKQQELAAARSAEIENQKMAVDGRKRAQVRVKRITERITRAADADLDVYENPRDEEERAQDNQLWGGPQTPRKPLWGSPLEPPVSVLIRGEHIVMLALEGNEDCMDSRSEDMETAPAGRKLGMHHFMRSLRAEVPEHAQRPVVVLSQKVPYDWPQCVAEHKEVYFIIGRPLAKENLEAAGIIFAKAVIVYQRGPVTSHDPTLVDAQAIFGTVLAQSILQKARKEILCIVDLNLDDNAHFVALEEKEAAGAPKDEMSMAKVREILEQEGEDYVQTKRYVTGQLFTSQQALTSLAANMLYNSAIGSLVCQMLACRFVIIPVPMIPETVKPDGSGKIMHETFGELYEYLLRRRNLCPVALLRNFAPEGEEDDDPAEGEIRMASWVKRVIQQYYRGESPNNRFIYTAPSGDRELRKSDGVMCCCPRDDQFAFAD